MIKTAVLNETPLDLKNELDNDNSKLQLWDEEETYEITDGKLATGQVMKLMVSGEEIDRARVVVKGDVTGDGKITLADSVAVINHYLGKTLIEKDYFFEAADIDGNGRITLADSVSIINHYLGKSLIHS